MGWWKKEKKMKRTHTDTPNLVCYSQTNRSAGWNTCRISWSIRDVKLFTTTSSLQSGCICTSNVGAGALVIRLKGNQFSKRGWVFYCPILLFFCSSLLVLCAELNAFIKMHWRDGGAYATWATRWCAGLLDCIFVESLCDVYVFNEIKQGSQLKQYCWSNI